MDALIASIGYIAAACIGFMLGIIYSAACEAWREHTED